MRLEQQRLHSVTAESCFHPVGQSVLGNGASQAGNGREIESEDLLADCPGFWMGLPGFQLPSESLHPFCYK